MKAFSHFACRNCRAARKSTNKRVRYLQSWARPIGSSGAYAPHVRPIATALRWQGLRVGEALRVDWLHIDWKKNSIYIPETKNGEAAHDQLCTRRHVPSCIDLWVQQHSPGRGAGLLITHRGQPYSDPRQYKVPGGSPIKKAHATACRRVGDHGFSRPRLAAPLGKSLCHGGHRS